MKGPTILLIDDDAAAVSAARRALEAEGYCVPAPCGQAAGFEKIRELQPDLVILAAKRGSGDASGLRLPAEVRKDPRIAHIPILMVSAGDEGRAAPGGSPAAENEGLPIDGFIGRRVRPQDLCRRAGALLEMRISKWARKFSS